jgi:tripartite-type tricarboxylate transporter receptor subunit TctC
MARRHWVSLTSLVLLFAATAAWAEYPDRIVKIIVPYPAGGTTDILARLAGDRLEKRLGQRFMIENRGGASGSIGTAAVAQSAPDGYTLLMGTINTHGINSSAFKSLSYDPVKDFAPITVIGATPNVLIVHPSLGVSDLAGIIKMAREKPGVIDFGSTSTGGSPHMSGELLKMMAKIDLKHVPYRGGGPMLNDLIGGHVKMAFDNMPSAIGQIQGGTVKAVAVTTAKRWPGLPDVPTIAESGVPGYNVSAWFGLLAPAKTPPAIVELLHRTLVEILREDDVSKRLAELGAEPGGEAPAAFRSRIEMDVAKWAEVYRETGLKPE